MPSIQKYFAVAAVLLCVLGHCIAQTESGGDTLMVLPFEIARTLPASIGWAKHFLKF